MSGPVRYRFGPFVLSPRDRTLRRDGRPVPLIPRYLDLLLLLVVRRHDAVSKAVIFDQVWTDVIVSDGALTQAIRTLRRALEDDPRQPLFIRTVSRHGYQFVGDGVIEEPDAPAAPRLTDSPAAPRAAADLIAVEVERLLSAGTAAEAREAAERLHALGTDAAVPLLKAHPGHARALAFLRDARWADAGAGDVPLADDPERAATALALVRLRFADGAPLVAWRTVGAATIGLLAGAAAGAVGGVVLALAPGSTTPFDAALALATIGAAAGGPGVAAVVAGVATAEIVSRSARTAAVVAGAALSAGLAGLAAHLVVLALLRALFGFGDIPIPGLLEGLVVGAAVGLAYAVTTRHVAAEGLAAPAGRARLRVVAAAAAACAVAGVGVALAGRPLVGGLVHEVAVRAAGSQLVLAPLGRLIGDPDLHFGARAWLAGFEGAVFGMAVALSLTRPRPKAPIDGPSRNAQAPVSPR